MSTPTAGATRPRAARSVAWAREATERGAGEILLTSMDRDGTADGYDLELTRAVADAVTVPVIASGGAGVLEHLSEGILEGSADAVLCASIFHYGTYTVRQAKDHLRKAGIPIRSGVAQAEPEACGRETPLRTDIACLSAQRGGIHSEGRKVPNPWEDAGGCFRRGLFRTPRR